MPASPPEELSADDAAILALESPAVLGHTLKLLLLEPGERPLDAARLRALVGPRLDRVERARQRLDRDPDGAGARWVRDTAFDLGAHVVERDEAALAGREDVWRAAGAIMSERLDHRRPLWRLDLLGPLPDRRRAVVVRIHHAMADGIGCMRFLDALLWDEEGAERHAPASAPAPAPGVVSASRRRAVELLRLPGAVWRELAGRAPRSVLDRPISARRGVAFTTASIADLKRIGGSRPGHVTVNDVLLAALAGGLAEWLGCGVAPRRLRAQIPVSLHHRDANPDGVGNRDSFLNVDLPLGERDPLRRLDAVNAETAKRKRLGDAEELYDLFHALGRLPAVERRVARLASAPGEWSLSISNVPGPRGRVRVGGRRVELLCSVAEPAPRHALRVAALSCAGELAVGLCADPTVVPGVERLAPAIDAALAELRAAAIQ